ncbi:hypothetical protein CTheo_5757 [Ceratobasidium theobromae]|uniref:Triacylglycerol lipase n=1 Tax=Ceratobasidium theobromae TaxID=1582974 RepID=A0A5N5QGC1_9AGAM|nr:hypothetical protein CTheo_5757 [Ceratobasidium theobromae]
MNSACAPPTLINLYRRLLSAVNAPSHSQGRLWPRLGLSRGTTERLEWPRWLSFSALATRTATPYAFPSPQRNVPKRRPDLDSPIYELMDNPVLFDPIRAPRNKIVLCHGLYGFDVRGPSYFPKLQLHYWSRVLDILRGRVGADVVVTGVPGTGSIEERATLMHNALSERVSGQPINFIAHSMGGLDCRHLISHIRPTEYTPTSLTTISTPHRGSSFMDWCAANIGIGDLPREPASETVPYSLKEPLLSRPPPTPTSAETTRSILGLITSLPQSLTTMLLALIDSPAYANLTTHFLSNTFNINTPDVPGVRYFSVGARARHDMSVFHPLWLPKAILDAAEARFAGRTPEWGSEFSNPETWHGHDGLVSVASAQWGEFLGVIEGADHWELRGSTGPGPGSSHAAPAGSGMAPDSEVHTNGWTEWAKSFTLWKDARAVETQNQKPVDPESDEGRQRATVTAALDWVVNAVSSSHAANPGGERDPARVERRRKSESEGVPVFELERFYVALCKRLYDEGL